MSSLYAFVSGMIALGSAVAATFFLKFWRRSKDRLFLMFSLSFWLLALERAMNAILHEDHVAVFTLRFVAFMLIIVAIVDKNRSEKK